MATSKLHESLCWAAPAGEDLSAKLHYLADVNTDGALVLAGDGAACIGNLYEVGVAGKNVSVQFGGIGKVVVAETVAIGAIIASDATGKAVNAAAGDHVVGMAVSGADANGIVSFIHLSGRRHA